MVCYSAYKASIATVQWKRIFLINIVYVTVLDVVDLFVRIDIVPLQILWMLAVVIVIFSVFPYVIKTVKSDFANIFQSIVDDTINAIQYPHLNLIPIIVFPDKVEIKERINSKVIYSVNLLETIEKYMVKTLTNQEKDAIYLKLVNLNMDMFTSTRLMR